MDCLHINFLLKTLYKLYGGRSSLTVFTVWFTSLHFLLNEIDILNVDVFNGMKNSKEKMTSRHGALHHLYFGAEPWFAVAIILSL